MAASAAFNALSLHPRSSGPRARGFPLSQTSPNMTRPLTSSHLDVFALNHLPASVLRHLALRPLSSTGGLLILCSPRLLTGGFSLACSLVAWASSLTGS